MTKDLPDDFFVIKKDFVLSALPRSAIVLYANPQYLDLTKGDLCVDATLLHIDDSVTAAIHALGIPLPYTRRGLLVDNISYDQASSVCSHLGVHRPTAALWYKVIVPFVDSGACNASLTKAFRESVSNQNEFLEGIIRRVRQNALQLRVGTAVYPLNLPPGESYNVNGLFDRKDLAPTGFPTTVHESGELEYFGPNDFIKPIGKELYPYGGGPKGEVVSVRNVGGGLNLLFTRSDFQDNLGIRRIWVENEHG